MISRSASTCEPDTSRGIREAAAAALAIVMVATAMATTAQAGSRPTERIGEGSDVVTSAVDLSQTTFADGDADRIVLGRDDAFPDSLAATALAGDRGPILYTTGGPDADIRPETLTEILRVSAPDVQSCDQTDDVIIVGGPDVVSERAAQQIRDAGPCVRRIEGPARYETARFIAEEVRERENASTVIVARADDWADAATGGAFAAFTGTPIIVTDTGSLHPEARAFLQSTATTDAVILGGTAAISAQTEAEIAALVDVRRVWGAARDLTALAIAEELWAPEGGPDDRVHIVNGYTELGWAYAFAAAPYSAFTSSPQLYTQTDVLTGSTCRYLTQRPDFAFVAGSTDVITEAVRLQADRAIETGECGDTSPDPDRFVNGLAMVVSPIAADDDYSAGLYVAEPSGLNAQLLIGGQFGFPSWHPDGDQIVVAEAGVAGSGDRVVLIDLDGTLEVLFEVAPGEQVGRVAINPASGDDDIEVAYELVLAVPDGEGGDAAVYIERYSESGGRERLTSGGSALMSHEPYSSEGRLAYSDGGQVMYQDADLNPQVLDFGAFAEPEWGPDGYIAYQTSDGASIRQVGSADPALLVGPGSNGETDWFPSPASDATEVQVVFNDGGGTDASDIYALELGALGSVSGRFPDVSSGGYLVTSLDYGQNGLVVYDDQPPFAVSQTLDVPAWGYSYPPILYPAP